jgi:peptidoglycan/LPS O-acetylase OafA/YrhL
MRIKQLDLFRAAAILLVIVYHYGPPMPRLPLGAERLFAPVFHRGWMGVDLFFVISGFLIAGLLFTEFKSRGEIDVKRFFVRRGLKIYPAFYVLLFATVVVGWTLGRPFSRAGFLCELVFFQNYGPGLWVHTWSLGVEEQFYLTLPFALCLLASLTGGLPRLYRRRFLLIAVIAVVIALPAVVVSRLGLAQEKVLFSLTAGAAAFWLLAAWGILMSYLTRRGAQEERARNPFRLLPHSFVFVAVLCLALRAVTAFELTPWESKSHSFPSHLHMDSLMFGVLLSYFHHFEGERLKRFVERRSRTMTIVLLLMTASLFAFDIEKSLFFQVFGFTLLYVLFGGLLLLSLYSRSERAQKNRVLSFTARVGLYSYSIYLWHVPLVTWVFEPLIRPNPGPLEYFAGLAAYTVSSVVVGILMAKLIEQPVLHFRDRFFPSNTKRPPVDMRSAGETHEGDDSSPAVLLQQPASSSRL